VCSVARETVTKRFEAGVFDQPDMLGSFIRHGMTFDECKNEATFMIAAGSDTTSSVIRCTMLHLMTHPRCYQKLKDAVRDALKTGKISSPITQAQGMEISYIRVSWMPSRSGFSRGVFS
jgi:cytochrome P450